MKTGWDLVWIWIPIPDGQSDFGSDWIRFGINKNYQISLPDPDPEHPYFYF